MFNFKSSLVLFFLGILCLSVYSAEVVPVANVTLLAGQYSLRGEKSAFGGNLDVFYSPVINFNQQTALIPIFTLLYRGTKDVQELVGGGTLTQEYLDGGLSLKMVKKFSPELKGKARLGYKQEYLKETKDEQWQKGLFDFNKIIIGFELERAIDSGSLRSGIDYYTMKYPNFSSLVSQYSTGIDTTTYKEISENAGKNVLDYNTIQVFIEANRRFSEKSAGKIAYNLSNKSFVEQKVIDQSGSFTGTLRADTVHYIDGSLAFDLNSKTSLTIGDAVMYYVSNQNSYDANTIRYTPNFYGFVQNEIKPSVLFRIGEKPFKTVDIYLNLAYRLYQERLAQDSAGAYKADKTSQLTSTIGLVYNHPVVSVKGLAAQVSLNYRNASSNMEYERNYKYNYYVSNYFVGINWAY